MRPNLDWIIMFIFSQEKFEAITVNLVFFGKFFA